jgi:TonB family protein
MVKSAGFSSVETSGPAPARRVLATKQNFDATASASNHLTPDKTTPGKITSGTFGDASVATAAAPLSDRASLANLSAAEILSKPRPEYTEEARRLKIEGEVLLEVLFGASGDARVLRLIRGLGHGLDENAILAIRAIQFRPARRGHAAVDSTAVVHIVFQLAY